MNQDKAETAATLRALFQNAKTGSLSVIDPDHGGPYVALVNVACDHNMNLLLLISSLARHTKGLLQNAKTSLLLNADLPKSGDALTALRATVSGTCEMTADPDLKLQFLKHHPYAKNYAEFGDFNLWKLQPERIYVVGGFGRIFEFTPAELLQT